MTFIFTLATSSSRIHGPTPRCRMTSHLNILMLITSSQKMDCWGYQVEKKSNEAVSAQCRIGTNGRTKGQR